MIYGINAVREALRADRVARVLSGPRDDQRIRAVLEEAAARGVSVEQVPREKLDRLSHGGGHQGIAAELRAAGGFELSQLVAAATATPLLVVLDGVEDPHNVGAILRSCDAAGADGLIRQTRRAAPLDGAAVKASAGAVAHVRVAGVVNIARAIEELKSLGVWTVGLDAAATLRYDELDLTMPVAFVLGAEGTGLRRLVRESCDWLVRIPMHGQVGSLNVSVTAGIMLFEARRQRKGSGPERRETGQEKGKRKTR